MGKWLAEAAGEAAKTMVVPLLKKSFIAVAGASFGICAIISVAGIVFYMAGIKKGEKIAVGSLLTFLIIQTIKGAII